MIVPSLQMTWCRERTGCSGFSETLGVTQLSNPSSIKLLVFCKSIVWKLIELQTELSTVCSWLLIISAR